MQDFSALLFQILDGLIKILLPVVAGVGINYLAKKIGREKFSLAKDVIGSIVSTLEQQYRSGEIPKDDRFSLALEQGVKRTGLTEQQVALLIKEAVFIMNAQLGKYTYAPAAPQSFNTQGSVSEVATQPADSAVAVMAETPSLIDSLVIPGKG